MCTNNLVHPIFALHSKYPYENIFLLYYYFNVQLVFRFNKFPTPCPVGIQLIFGLFPKTSAIYFAASNLFISIWAKISNKLITRPICLNSLIDYASSLCLSLREDNSGVLLFLISQHDELLSFSQLLCHLFGFDSLSVLLHECQMSDRDIL